MRWTAQQQMTINDYYRMSFRFSFKQNQDHF